MTDQDTAQNHERFVDIGASFPADAQATELMQPGQGALHHPTCLAQATSVGRLPSRQDGRDAAPAQRVTMRLGIVTTIALYPVGSEAWVTHAPGHRRNRLDQHQQLGHVVAMRPGQNRGERKTVRVRDDVVLRPVLATIRGIGARLIPPKTARTEAESTTARDQSIRLAACNRASSVRWILSQTPTFCQSRSLRQHVIPVPHPICGGTSSQGMPVFNTNRIPVNTERSSNRLRPGYRNRRRFLGNNGSINSHNASSNTDLAMKVPPSHDRKINSIKHNAHSFC